MKNLSRRELLQGPCTAAAATTPGSNPPGQSTTVAPLLIAGGSAPPSKAAAYLETGDGAKIYYEDHGEGQPILLVHGWLCSSKFWQRNVPELANEFRVVTVDLRGHGNSSKALTGQTLKQYARDLREVIEHLWLQETVLVGWSLGGPVILSYYEQYGGDNRLKGLGLVDSAPFPFSPADWNSHALRNYNYDGMNATFANLTANPRQFAIGFTTRMFKQKPSDADTDWVVAELMKTPTWIAEAVYSDFLMSDYAKSLPAIKVPVIVFAADSGVFPNGIAMGKAIADLVPQGTFFPFEDAGHLLFYEQQQKFNAALTDFVKAL
jgi:non-heme chloroperoxidase